MVHMAKLLYRYIVITEYRWKDLRTMSIRIRSFVVNSNCFPLQLCLSVNAYNDCRIAPFQFRRFHYFGVTVVTINDGTVRESTARVRRLSLRDTDPGGDVKN